MSSYGMWLSASGMQVNEFKQTIAANNMANANTTGFKHDLAMIYQRKVESRENLTPRSRIHPVFENMAGGLEPKPNFFSTEQAMGTSIPATA